MPPNPDISQPLLIFACPRFRVGKKKVRWPVFSPWDGPHRGTHFRQVKKPVFRLFVETLFPGAWAPQAILKFSSTFLATGPRCLHQAPMTKSEQFLVRVSAA